MRLESRGGRRLLPRIAACVLVVAAGWFAWRSAAGRLKPAAPETVFLIVVDTMRADRLSAYGYRGHSTPNIDRIASLGVTFTRAESVGSWTRPSMGAILTALYPAQLGFLEAPPDPPGRIYGIREKHPQLDYQIAPSVRTIGDLMRQAGFHTAAFVNQPILQISGVFRRGYDEFYYPSADGQALEYGRQPPAAGENLWHNLQHTQESDRVLVAEFERWMKEAAGGRLFAWIHLLTPHDPYRPSDPFRPKVPPSGSASEKSSAMYDAEIREVDEMVGRILDAIEKHAGLERSLIVFTSDHGEEFGEHGSEGHGHSLHREVMHVPLIIAAPGVLPAASVERRVRTLDILPTILDIEQIPPPDPFSPSGASLLPAMSADGRDRPCYAEGMYHGNTQRSIILDGQKLIVDAQTGRALLYDVLLDPEEAADLSSSRPEQARMLLELIDDWHWRLQIFYQRENEKEKKQEENEREPNREEMEQALRSLGYVQ